MDHITINYLYFSKVYVSLSIQIGEMKRVINRES